MGWIGKLGGAGLGSIVGGPIGAAIGAAVGHAVDSYFASEEGEEETGAGAFLYSLGSFLYFVGQADGEFCTRERKLVCEILYDTGRSLGLELDQDTIETLVNAACNDHQAARNVIELAQSSDQLRFVLLRFAWRVAAKNLTIDDVEVRAIMDAAQAMGASEQEFFVSGIPFYRFGQSAGDQDEARALLGVTREATSPEIEAAYRKLSIKYHPDRHVSAAPELKELTARRFSEIHDAYQALKAGPTRLQLFGRSATGKLTGALDAGDVVLCFICDRKCRLPTVEYHGASRCPDCQSLLLFEKEVAESLMESDDDSSP